MNKFTFTLVLLGLSNALPHKCKSPHSGGYVGNAPPTGSGVTNAGKTGSTGKGYPVPTKVPSGHVKPTKVPKTTTAPATKPTSVPVKPTSNDTNVAKTTESKPKPAENKPPKPQTVVEQPGNLSATLQECLNVHNKARVGLGLKPLVWNTQLQQSATAYNNVMQASGKFQHSMTPGLGENLYWSSGLAISCAIATESWLDERKEYNGEPIGRNYATGHYTQIIYPDVTSVGCGVSENYVTCQYNTIQMRDTVLEKW